jgi:hypothetical protein
MDWLLEAKTDDYRHATFKNQDVIVIAQNFKGYNGQFILNYLVHAACIKPSVILNWNKILSMEVCGLELLTPLISSPVSKSRCPPLLD